MAHKVDTNLTGAAGEHLVLSRLLSKGLLAAQAPRGTRKADILVNILDSGKSYLIQVKSRQYGSDGGWHMSEKHEQINDKDLFYCFVDFEPKDQKVYVLPATVVADAVQKDHSIWLSTPGRNGKQHNPNPMRRVRPASLGQEPGWLEPYLERWEFFSA
jgi:hypothetical protein